MQQTGWAPIQLRVPLTSESPESSPIWVPFYIRVLSLPQSPPYISVSLTSLNQGSSLSREKYVMQSRSGGRGSILLLWMLGPEASPSLLVRMPGVPSKPQLRLVTVAGGCGICGGDYRREPTRVFLWTVSPVSEPLWSGEISILKKLSVELQVIGNPPRLPWALQGQ